MDKLREYLKELDCVIPAIRDAGYPCRKCQRKTIWKVRDGVGEFKVIYSRESHEWSVEGENQRLREIVQEVVSRLRS